MWNLEGLFNDLKIKANDNLFINVFDSIRLWSKISCTSENESREITKGNKQKTIDEDIHV